VQDDLARKRLDRIFPKTPLLFDHFRLVFRIDDPRRPIYEALAETIRAADLK
jgi:hypothetical protein